MGSSPTFGTIKQGLTSGWRKPIFFTIAMPDNKQIVRQLNILFDLAARRYGVTYRELAEQWDVSTRTIQRDLNDLLEVGFIINREPRDGIIYITLEKTNLPLPLNFHTDEIIALTFIEGIISPLEDEDTPYKKAFQNTLNRIRATLSEPMRTFLEKAGAAYYPHRRKQKELISPEVLETAHRAINEHKVCNITYRAITTGETKTYPITPFRLLYYHNGHYLLCRNPKYDDLLTLAAERIQALELTSETFEPPDDLDIENRIQQAYGITLEDPIDVKIRFSAWQARYIKQRIWHPSQEIEERDTGEIILTFRASGFYDIKSWILSHGADAEVLEPAALREAIMEELKKNLTFYQKT